MLTVKVREEVMSPYMCGKAEGNTQDQQLYLRYSISKDKPC